jgi:asparagine synthase (glutamine-hydrolysing)
MCGIAGSWNPSGGLDLSRAVRSMTEVLRHRGPDAEGYWLDNTCGLSLGHRRLAVQDLTDQGLQPMASHDGRYVLVYNGEVYNAPELRDRLRGLSVAFTGHSDTEVLVEAIASWGIPATLDLLNGMFAFAVWDRENDELILARDRMGEKPLYYGRIAGGVAFASEVRSLHQHPGWVGRIDRDALTLFIRHGYVPAPWSIYEDVWKLPPGHLLRIADPVGALEPEPYWSLGEPQLVEPASDREATDHLEKLLLSSVRQRLLSDVPVGAFLSGGIDSSLVVAMMSAAASGPVRTFTMGFAERAFDESSQARQVAGHLGTDHTEEIVTPEDVRGVIPDIPHVYDEPFADSSQLPTVLLSRLARRDVTVALTGDGGDELFSGYTRYALHDELWRRIRPIRPAARARLARTIRRADPATLNRLSALSPVLPRRFRTDLPGDKLHKLADVLDAGTPQKSYLSMMSYWQEPGTVVVGGREPLTILSDPQRWPPRADFSEQLAALDASFYLPEDLLVKVDRAAMSVSLETRLPLLDPHVISYASTLPMDFKVRGGTRKWLLRQVLRRHVPVELFDRPKMGFGVPLAGWLRGPLRSWADDMLDPSTLADDGYFDAEVVSRHWREHRDGVRDWKYRIWTVLMFQSWLHR